MTVGPGSSTIAPTARLAGFLYLIVVGTGFFSLGYVRSQLMAKGDVAGTMDRIAASESLFRASIAADVLCYTAFLILPFVLYTLSRPRHAFAAVLMVAFAVPSVPLAFQTVAGKLDLLSLVTAAGDLRALAPEHVHAQGALLLNSQTSLLFVLKVFWGLWLFPLGYLILRSGMIPRFLGALLIVGGAGYLMDFFGRLLVPGSIESVAQVVRKAAALGEVGTCLWLLIMGAKVTEPNLRDTSPAQSLDDPP